MGNEKMMNARLQQKHDIEANWIKAVNFIPKAGEIIIYDAETAESALPDGRTEPISYPRVKYGDGVSYVENLPFSFELATDNEIINMLAEEDMLVSVADSDGSILADENKNILIW